MPRNSLAQIRARDLRGRFVPAPPVEPLPHYEPPNPMDAPLGLNKRGQVVPAPLVRPKPPGRATSARPKPR